MLTYTEAFINSIFYPLSAVYILFYAIPSFPIRFVLEPLVPYHFSGISHQTPFIYKISVSFQD